jgi:prolyl-tRNA synthetase
MEEQQDFVKEITKMSVDFDRWYTDVIRKAELADWSGIRGCMVVRPYGWATWENLQDAFDGMIKESGHENMAFPLLIPEQLFSKEAEHVEGFAPEVAWVNYVGPRPASAPPEEWTDEEKKRMSDGWLSQPLVVRPTSETIIGPIVRRYIQSHRDLPQKLNQWCSVVRWEMRTRLFLRTREFWWQEGHTYHATAAEAEAEVYLILDYYRQLAEDWLAVPVFAGRKSDSEKFAGAIYTTSIEGMMRDGLALQMGTSHYFGQNFSRAFDISFVNRENQRELCYSTSWGVSTRLIGGLIMAHGDDSGLIMPPRVAPIQVAVVPIFRDAESRTRVEAFVEPLVAELKAAGVRVRADWRDDTRPGEKYAHWELKGVPIRLEVGPRDVEAGQVVAVDRLSREKRPLPVAGLGERLRTELEAFHSALFERARHFRDEHTVELGTLAELVEHFKTGIGFAWAPWCGEADCEAKVREEAAGVTSRIVQEGVKVEGPCLVCGRPALHRTLWARAY